MIIKSLLITIQLVVLSLFSYSVFSTNILDIQKYFVLLYIFINVFTLPSLISKIIFRSKLVGTSTVLSFLYFPLTFLFCFALHKATNIQLETILFVLGLINIFIWNILLLTLILKSTREYLFWLSDKILTSSFVSVIICIVVFVLFRQQDSIISLDYLQHQAVINNLTTGSNLCLLPSQCSTIFLQDGYTTFFHSIFGAYSSFIPVDTLKAFFIADIAWPILIGLVTFKIGLRIFRNDLYASILVILSSLAFVNGAYEYTLLIPQTFAFLLFLNILSERKVNSLLFILSISTLILSHFIMGTFLAALLSFRFPILYYFTKLTKSINNLKFIIFILFLILFSSLLIHSQGFSIERILQSSEVEYIGGITNSVFPNSINAIFAPLGPVSLLTIISIIYYLFSKNKSKDVYFALVMILTGIITYLIGPTYANKFLIGIGLFSSILILNYFRNIDVHKKAFKALPLFVIISGISLSFNENINKYLEFYTRENQVVSAVSYDDIPVTNYINENKLECKILSDPISQIIVAGFSHIQTFTGQYMSLDNRQKLFKFIDNPNEDSFMNIKNISDSDTICFLYSSRLEHSLYENQTNWLYNIYILNQYSGYGARKNSNLIDFMNEKDISIIYQDDNYILFEGV